ncbi:MAG: efflux RND transporter periplasmic adaptor subunit [Pseudomonadota bacterium]
MAAEVSPARKWLRRLGAFVVFGFNGAVAVAILIFGTTFLQQRASATPTVEAAPLPKVAVMRLDRSESYDLTRRFIGQVEATRSTDLAFERGGTVAEVLVEEGESVVAGEIVATLDIRSLEATIARHEATRRALESDRELAVLTLERTQKLEERGFAATQAFDEARLGLNSIIAGLAEVDASIASTRIDIEKSVLRAPFDATVGSRNIDDGSIAGAGQAVLSLLENRAPLVRVGLSPDRARGLSVGDTHLIVLDGQQLGGTLAHIRPDIDPATRTVPVLFELPPNTTAPFGQTVELVLTDTIAESGFWVPITALKEGQRGLWTVLAAADEGDLGVRVVTEAVEVIHLEDQRAFVRGTLTEETPILATGTHRVSAGQYIDIEG